MSAHTPDWVKHAVFYQIFPDRFARSATRKPPKGIEFKAWGSPPEEQGFQGGDLYGIIERLDYLTDLGVNALYLNPIFASASNHRYHTYDYLTVDPLLGGEAGLRALLDAAHARGIKVVLDAVFNHAGRGFWAFHHILENGGDSPYLDWFIIHGWPLRPYQHDDDHPINYAAWWGIPALPKFNTSNPGVREHLLHVAQYWIEFGVDGWRIDVPEEIDDEAFWQDFRRVVKQANPDAYIVGEIWHDALHWLRGDRFDAVMNYVFNRATLGFFAHKTLRADYVPGGFHLSHLNESEFAAEIERMIDLYDQEVVQAQLNLLGSHDTARVLWAVDGDRSALRLATLMQMTMPGAPCVYYGDEIGMSGSDDPGCRGAFLWEDRASWDQDLLKFYRRVIAMRHAHPVLRRGSYDTVYAENGIFGFLREAGHDRMLIFLNRNRSNTRIEVALPAAPWAKTALVDVWGGKNYVVNAEGRLSLTMPARDAVVLVAK